MSKYHEMTHEEVLAECKKYMNDEHLAFVESAYEFAKKAHVCHKTLTGSFPLIMK